jgi:hypothetical protein
MLGRRTVEGWLSYGACQMIIGVSRAQHSLGVTGNVAEIGVHQGRLFVLLALLAQEGEEALAIDLFEQQEFNLDKSGAGDLSKFRANVRRHTGRRAPLVHRGDSTILTGEAVKAIAGGPIRLFSVDGGHTEEITLHDLETAEASLATGGVIILDDCFNGGWPGVISGTCRFLKDGHRRVVPFAIGCNKTFFAEPSFAKEFRLAMTRAPMARFVEQRFFGHAITCFDYETPLTNLIRASGLWKTIKTTQIGLLLKDVYAKVSALR